VALRIGIHAGDEVVHLPPSVLKLDGVARGEPSLEIRDAG
jgi:hypothetical protein